MIHKTRIICKKCRKEFETYFKNQIFCSHKCYDKTGKKNPKWRGGFFYDKGYRYIYSPNHPFATKMGYVREHRLVMEKSVGRYLEPSEIVHHINGNIVDNRIENLVITISPGRHFIEHHFKGRDKLGRFRF